MKDLCYKAEEKFSEKSSNVNYYLHTHDDYEIYLFLEGDSNYIVENSTYSLKRGDMLVFRKNEAHRIFHNKKSAYRRFILMVSPKFFSKYNCKEYENVFKDSTFDEGNKISAEIVKLSGIYDAVMRLKNYTDEYTNQGVPVAVGVVMEILYLIGKISDFEPHVKGSALIKRIISYININIDKDISLDRLSSEFYISKYHLCRSFKKSTGLTIKEYINNKRLALVSEYVNEGKSLSSAAAMAGFKDYSSFYRSFVKNNNINPKTLKQQNNT